MTVPVGVIVWAWVMVAVSYTELPSGTGLVIAVVGPGHVDLGRHRSGRLTDNDGLGPAGRLDPCIVGVAVVHGHPVVGAHHSGRERVGAGAAAAERVGQLESGVPVQVGLEGANRSKVTVPVGLKPSVTVAVSEMGRAVGTARRNWCGGDGRGGLTDDHGLGPAGGGDRRVVDITVRGRPPTRGCPPWWSGRSPSWRRRR